MRRFFAVVLVVVLLAAAVSAPASGLAPFPDALDSPSGSAALLLQALDILGGYPDGTFRPDVSITRAEFAAVLARLLRATGRGLAATTPPFADVTSAYQWAAADIALAANRGLMKGDPGGTFRPGDRVTGGEVATALVRLLGYDPEAIKSTSPWPTNSVNMAEALGVWSDGYPVAYPASRGMLATCLARALSVPLATQTTGSGGATLLSDMGLRRVTAIAQAVKPRVEGGALLTLPDGTVSPADGHPDDAVLTSQTIIWGVETAGDLAGKRVIAYLGKDATVLHIETLSDGTIDEIADTSGSRSIWLDGGYSTVLDSRLPILLNHRSASITALGAGTFIRLNVNATGSRIISLTAYAQASGAIMRWSERSYLIDSASDALIPVDAATVYSVNGRAADKEAFDRALANSEVATGTVTWNTGAGTAARLELAAAEEAYAGRTVQASDLEFVHGVTLRCITLVDDSTVYPIAPTAVVVRDGSPTDAAPGRGDKVSFSIDPATGDISYLQIETDGDAPQLSAPVTATTEECRLAFDEPLDPAKIVVSVDGVAYGTIGANMNTYSLADNDDNGSTIVLRPQRRFTDRSHTVTYEVADYAGNIASGTVTFPVNSTPMRVASVEWPSTISGSGYGPIEVHIYLFGDHLIDEATAKDLRNWTFADANPANGVTHIAAVTHAGYYVTLVFDGPIDPGSRLKGSLRDSAGNSVVVDCVYSGS